MIFEQLDVVFADRSRKQLAEVCRGIEHVLGRNNLAGIDDSADPYFVQIRMVFDQFLEIDGVDQGSLAIGISVDLYGLFDQRQRRAGAQARGGNTLVALPSGSQLENS